MSKWTTADIPDQTGRTAVITGANNTDAQRRLWAVSEELTGVVCAVGRKSRAGAPWPVGLSRITPREWTKRGARSVYS
jgi:hypothetical protein